MRANERTDERVAQYFSLYSWLLSTIVQGKQMAPSPVSRKAVAPPFVPEYKDPTNPRNFKKRVIEEPIRVSAHDLMPEVFFDF